MEQETGLRPRTNIRVTSRHLALHPYRVHHPRSVGRHVLDPNGNLEILEEAPELPRCFEGDEEAPGVELRRSVRLHQPWIPLPARSISVEPAIEVGLDS